MYDVQIKCLISMESLLDYLNGNFIFKGNAHFEKLLQDSSDYDKTVTIISRHFPIFTSKHNIYFSLIISYPL